MDVDKNGTHNPLFLPNRYGSEESICFGGGDCLPHDKKPSVEATGKSGETRTNATMLWEDLCDMDVEVSDNESDASSQVSDLVDFMSEEESEDSADKLVRNTLKRKSATSDQANPTKKQKQEDKSQPSLKSFFSQRD